MRIGGRIGFKGFVLLAVCAGFAALLAVHAPARAGAAQATLTGKVASGKLPVRGTQVTLYRHRQGGPPGPGPSPG